MKTQFTLMVIGSSLLLAAPALLAQNNSSTDTQTGKYQRPFEGERLILPAGLTEKLHLTEEQTAELKPIEDDFANTSKQYQVANQPRINAALEANRQARESKDTAQIQAARKQLQDVWAGLQPYRAAAVNQIKPLLTPGQLALLEDPRNQWRENHVDEANDPSAN
jgi:Spy/CpxP family protein refolding chaperone